MPLRSGAQRKGRRGKPRVTSRRSDFYARASAVTVVHADGTTSTRAAYRPHELAHIVKERTPITPALRACVLARDKGTCRYCGTMCGPFEIDHVHPVAKGGTTTIRNLVTACSDCNRRKGTDAWKPRPLPTTSKSRKSGIRTGTQGAG